MAIPRLAEKPKGCSCATRLNVQLPQDFIDVSRHKNLPVFRASERRRHRAVAPPRAYIDHKDQDQDRRERDLAPRFFLHAGSRREKIASRNASKMMDAGVGTTPIRSRHTGTGHRASVLLCDTPRTSLESKSWPSSLHRLVDRFSRWCNPRGQARELTSDASRALACADPSIGHVDGNLPPSRLRNHR